MPEESALDRSSSGISMIKVCGFSGSQDGITPQQRGWLVRTMHSIGMTEFHHGGCVGSDEEAHRIALECFTEPAEKPIKVHPASGVAPWKVSGVCLRPHPLVEVLPPKKPLLRNRDIANPAQILLATPNSEERLRSGTWATVRYARKIGVPVWVCYPDGTTGGVMEKEINE
jgi:hypothetical protein